MISVGSPSVDLSLAVSAPAVGVNLALIIAGACLSVIAAVGLWLMHAPEKGGQQEQATRFMCVSLALAAFLAVGFAFAMGGVSGSYRGLGPLSGLGREWTPRGDGQGLLGLAGFFLSGAAYEAGVYSLFLLQAALLLVSAVIALISWVGRVQRLLAAAYSLLFGGFLYPVVANWVWGGGWLANLGQTHLLGHGVVDFAGSGVVNAAAGSAALGALLALRRAGAEDSTSGDADAPGSSLLAGLGLTAAGWVGMAAASTFSVTDTRLAIAAANVLVALICGATVGLLYTWFAAGEPDVRIGAQAGLAGLVAAAAGAPFFPAWAAALAGAIAGLLVPFAGSVLERILHSRNGAMLVASHGVGGMWGLLAVGLMADGSYGAGWNGVGVQDYRGAAGQGVTGLFPAGPAPADSSQLTAQFLGVIVLLALAVVSWLIVRVGRWLARS